MKSFKLIASSAVLALLVSSSVHSEPRPGKAVFEYSAESGMKISDVALSNIEVRLTKLGGNSAKVPLETLVFFQDETGVYRKRDGWFKLVPVKVLSQSSKDASIQSDQLREGDEIATHGADLLRVSELDAAGGGE